MTAGLDVPDDEVQRLYGPDYFHGQEYADYVAEAASLTVNFRRRLAVVDRLVGDTASKALFEIGCAYGFFLDLARTRYRTVAGVDVSPHAVRYARDVLGLEAWAGDYLEHDLPRQYDVFCMWDTIEHLTAPDRFVEKVARDVVPGGLLAITTGDIASLNARLRGRKWRMIHPPTHLHYFSVKTLSQLLDRHGFDVIYLEHPGNARTVRSILYMVLALRMGRLRLFRLINALPGLGASLTINLFDIMYVIARRRT